MLTHVCFSRSIFGCKSTPTNKDIWLKYVKTVTNGRATCMKKVQVLQACIFESVGAHVGLERSGGWGGEKYLTLPKTLLLEPSTMR